MKNPNLKLFDNIMINKVIFYFSSILWSVRKKMKTEDTDTGRIRTGNLEVWA